MSQISQKKKLIEMIKIVMMIGRTQGVGTSISWKN